MTRNDLKKIDNDRIVIDLRMQSEDLINNIESVSQKMYDAQAKHIKDQIDERIFQVLNKNKE